jgi:hypothetical protein
VSRVFYKILLIRQSYSLICDLKKCKNMALFSTTSCFLITYMKLNTFVKW